MFFFSISKPFLIFHISCMHYQTSFQKKCKLDIEINFIIITETLYHLLTRSDARTYNLILSRASGGNQYLCSLWLWNLKKINLNVLIMKWKTFRMDKQSRYKIKATLIKKKQLDKLHHKLKCNQLKSDIYHIKIEC